MARNAKASSKAGPATKQSTLHNNMGRISKRAAPAKTPFKKEIAERAFDEETSQSRIEILIPAKTPTAPIKKNKRKAVAIEDSDDEAPITKKAHVAPASTPTRSRRVKQTRRVSTVPSSSADTSSSADVSSTDTDLPDAPDAIFGRLSLRSSPCGTRSSSPNTSITSAGESDHDIEAQFPQELVDLLNLHAAFLKTVSLQYAHNGTANPINVESICPSVSQSWGKRRMTLADIQRCIAVLDYKPRKGIFEVAAPAPGSPFYICDYGRGRVCIELIQEAAAASGPFVLNEQKLHATFEKNLRKLWAARGATFVHTFINKLPLAEIRKSESLAKMAPMGARGQQVLQELKNGIVLKQQQKGNNATSSAAPSLNADGSKMSLLDRIRMKQQQNSQAASGPSAAELARQAALQRAADVAAVISMLSRATATLGSPQRRVAFTMASVLTKLRDSMSVPLSKEEAALCVRLLASEITPNWLRIVAVGGRENVVVFLDYTPSNAEVEKRAQELSA